MGTVIYKFRGRPWSDPHLWTVQPPDSEPGPPPDSPFLPDSRRIGAAYHLLFGEQRACRWGIGACRPKSKCPLYRSRFLGQFLILFSPTSWSRRPEIVAPEPSVCVDCSAIINNASSGRFTPPARVARRLVPEPACDGTTVQSATRCCSAR